MSDAKTSDATQFLSYPTPKAHDRPYEAPPPYQNPTFSGLPLQIGANIIANVPLLPYLLWWNGGFGTLRHVEELETIDPRYDPTVIPLPGPIDTASISYKDEADIRFPPKALKGRFHTIADFHNAYKSGKTTPSDVIELLLPLIRRDVAQRSPHSTAFTETKVELVREAAEASTRRWKEGKPLGVLDGVPYTAKDDVDVKGYKRYTGTCNDYTGGKEVGTSWCVRKLEEQGAVLIGKANMHELGMDTTNNNPHWGTPLNPYNNSYYTGGSSGGPAYTVAAGLVPFTIGTDGGGSVRIPANYCGLFGLKPSHGRVSVDPMLRPWMSVVVTGPLASSMADLEVSYRVLAQPDPSNPVSAKFSPPKPLHTKPKKIIGICKSWFDQADPQVQEACQSALQYLISEHGYKIVDVNIPLLPQGQKAHTMTILAETAAKTKASKTDFSKLSSPNKVIIRVAQQTPATDFLLAQRLRNLLMEHLAHLFKAHPGLIIVTPTTPNAGWPIGDGELTHGVSDANKLLRNMEYVWLANFTGVPCIQFPVGYVNGVKGSGKIPVGMMGHGEWGSEDVLIEFGFDGEAWLHHEEKKIKPDGWFDVLAEAGA